MEKNRLEAFSDGVIAIIITIMVLELKVSAHAEGLADLKPLLPVLLSYLLSFIYVGIYWNNHHYMFHSTEKVTGGILWANLHLLFWLSLFPLTTAWVGANQFAPAPTAVYAFVLLMAAVAYYVLERAIIRQQGPGSLLAKALGNRWKKNITTLCYFAAISLAFVTSYISQALFIFVAIVWLVPDRRIERALTGHKPE